MPPHYQPAGLSPFSPPKPWPRVWNVPTPKISPKTWLWLWRRSLVSAIASAYSPSIWSPPVLPSITPFLVSCTISRTILLHAGLGLFSLLSTDHIIFSYAGFQEIIFITDFCFAYDVVEVQKRGHDRTWPQWSWGCEQVVRPLSNCEVRNPNLGSNRKHGNVVIAFIGRELLV